jgi:hypothetical protein
MEISLDALKRDLSGSTFLRLFGTMMVITGSFKFFRLGYLGTFSVLGGLHRGSQ